MMHTLVRQWKDSGLSQAKFATQNKLTLVKFRYWIKKLKEPTDIEPAFVQLKGFSEQSISLRYPNGVELFAHPNTGPCAQYADSLPS